MRSSSDIQAYQAVKGVMNDYDGLVDLFESIDHFLNRLDIYTKIPRTVGMTEIVVKILVELLSTLALATTNIMQGKSSGSFSSEVLHYCLNAIQRNLSRSFLERRTLRRFSKGSIDSLKMKLG